MLLNKNKPVESKLIAFLICLVILYFHFTLPKYSYSYTTEANWDILSYYLYLPLTFLKHDLAIHDYSYIQHLFDQYHFSPGFYQAAQAENGNYVMIYTMGMALLYSPFFAIGHLWATLGGYPTDGFSFPYQFCLSSGTMIYVVIGIFTLRKVLLHFFRERIVSVVLILLLLGTNYFREATDYNMGPHAILFSLYAILLLYTIRWHEQPRLRSAAMIGICVGFLTLIRPTELICIVIPLLWSIHDRSSFFAKITLIRKNKLHLLMMVACVILVGLPQLIYWKVLTGSFLYNSYWNQVSFDITESHFMQVFFSFRKGWLVYSPLIAFALLGLLLLFRKEAEKVRTPIIVFIILNIFILCHVPIWWNAGSFGQRFMVQSYAVLAIPMGYMIGLLFQRRFLLTLSVSIISGALVFLNLFQTWQFVRWILPGDGMTKDFYFATLFRTQPLTSAESNLLEFQRSYVMGQKFSDPDSEYRSHTIAFFNMDDLNTNFIDGYPLDTIAHSGRYSFRSSPDAAFSPSETIPYALITKKDHAWIRYSAWVYPTTDIKDCNADIVLHFQHRDKPYEYMGYHLADSALVTGKWNYVSVDYLTPAPFSDSDELHAYIWHTGKQALLVDDIRIEAFEKK
ncbi:MAG: hypothetical protein ACJ77K_12720 [Bacteroidia bacterium]